MSERPPKGEGKRRILFIGLIAGIILTTDLVNGLINKHHLLDKKINI